jgi:signal transduction histidine kinase
VSSLRRQLSLALLGSIAAIFAVAMAAVYLDARQEVDEMFDYELRAVAQSIGPLAAATPEHPPGRLPDDDVAVQLWSADRRLLYSSQPQHPAPYPDAAGYAALRGADGARWRSYSLAVGAATVQAAQTLGARRELALGMSLRLLAPLLLALPLLGLAIGWQVRRALRPVDRLGQALAARGGEALEPVDSTGLPRELLPLVDGFNRLLQRLGQLFAAQRALVADAAHELRTPLAVVRLQAQALEQAGEPQEREEAAQALRGGLERAGRLVQQLLTLARQEPGAPAAPPQPLRLDSLLREVLAELAPLAHEKNLELSLHAAGPVEVIGDAGGLQALAGNLVDNALRYTPAPGTVSVHLEAQGGNAVLRVCDSGPGIAPALRAPALQRFSRLPGNAASGSGLGLAIAVAVVERHRGRMELGEAENGGLEVRVELPLRGS